jgi:hypothetical protein
MAARADADFAGAHVLCGGHGGRLRLREQPVDHGYDSALGDDPIDGYSL